MNRLPRRGDVLRLIGEPQDVIVMSTNHTNERFSFFVLSECDGNPVFSEDEREYTVYDIEKDPHSHKSILTVLSNIQLISQQPL